MNPLRDPAKTHSLAARSYGSPLCKSLDLQLLLTDIHVSSKNLKRGRGGKKKGCLRPDSNRELLHAGCNKASLGITIFALGILPLNHAGRFSVEGDKITKHYKGFSSFHVL